MITHSSFRDRLGVVALFAIVLTLAACTDPVGAAENPVQEEPVASETSTPVPARVLERSAERWKLIVEAAKTKERWVEVYPFLTPAQREEYPITMYLPSKTKFHYADPTEPKLLKVDGDKAYVAVRASWLAYLNPDVKRVEGGENLVKPIQSIEEWHWVEGDWYLHRPHRESEFNRDNPGFFSRPPK